MLVHYESRKSVESAIGREKQLKEWLRKWKLRLIEETNPKWRDLYDEIAPGFRLPAYAGTGFAGIVHVPRDTTKDESTSVRVAQARADTRTFMAMTKGGAGMTGVWCPAYAIRRHKSCRII